MQPMPEVSDKQFSLARFSRYQGKSVKLAGISIFFQIIQTSGHPPVNTAP